MWGLFFFSGSCSTDLTESLQVQEFFARLILITFVLTTFNLMTFFRKAIVGSILFLSTVISSLELSGQQSTIFSDAFDDNRNNWDLFESALSKSEIKDGVLSLTSLTPKGTSRFVDVEANFQDFEISTTVLKSGNASEAHCGLIIGFKDWDNYLYFTSGHKYYSVGYFESGRHQALAVMNYSSDLITNTKVRMSVRTEREYFVFYLNDVIQYKMRRIDLTGKGVGFIISNKSTKVSFEDLVLKSGKGEAYQTPKDVKSSGSGFIISSKGHIVTNYHVVENASFIQAELIVGEVHKDFKLAVVGSDPANDLAILRVVDSSFTISEIPYSLKTGNLDLGASIYTLGFPLYLSGLGNEPKFTDGKVSSKSGFNNAINSFQTNLGVQPGNSGGPVFNSKGELVGVVSAKITNADNVSYAVKTSYLELLLESASLSVPDKNTISDLSLEEQLKKITDYVVLIKVY